jgi:hypothetical protein
MGEGKFFCWLTLEVCSDNDINKYFTRSRAFDNVFHTRLITIPIRGKVFVFVIGSGIPSAPYPLVINLSLWKKQPEGATNLRQCLRLIISESMALLPSTSSRVILTKRDESIFKFTFLIPILLR